MLRTITLAAMLLPATASIAQGYATRNIGAWLVSPSSDGQGCFLARTYQGPRETTLQFGLDVGGGHRLTILNANWSIRRKEQLRLDFRLSNASFPRHLAVGIEADGKRGFVTDFGTGFPGNFAASRFLHISRGDVPVDELDLTGSGAAIAALRQCVDQYRGARGTARSTGGKAPRIPVDPFATKAARDSKK